MNKLSSALALIILVSAIVSGFVGYVKVTEIATTDDVTVITRYDLSPWTITPEIAISNSALSVAIITSDGTEEKPYCTHGSSCTWNEETKTKCAGTYTFPQTSSFAHIVFTKGWSVSSRPL